MFNKKNLTFFIPMGLLYSLAFLLYLASFSIYGCLAALGIHLFLAVYAFHKAQLTKSQYKAMIIGGIVFFVLAKILYTWIGERDFAVIYESPDRLTINFFLAVWSFTPLLWSLQAFLKSKNKS